MAKQLLIYETAVPLSAARHGDVSLEAKTHYGFIASVNAVPLMAVEMLRAASEYAIVFAGTGDSIVPAAVLGVRGDQNLFLSPEAQWQAKYIPAFVRRYPFVFAASSDKKTLTLCIDETHAGVNRAGKGERLFDPDGQPSAYTHGMLKFLQEYQAQYERTKVFGRHLQSLGLLEPMQARVKTPDGEQITLGNFMAVSRSKLRALDRDALAALAKTDELELLYLHLYSMRNFNDIRDRLQGAAHEAHAPADVTTH